MPPDLVNAGAALADAGCSAIKVVPLFLGAGGHVRNDVPRLLQRLRQRCPDLELTLCRAIGEHPLVIEAMARGALE
jgi:sirohydrochlorin cobaltochelatase